MCGNTGEGQYLQCMHSFETIQELQRLRLSGLWWYYPWKHAHKRAQMLVLIEKGLSTGLLAI